jgi:hypothetical protein
MLAHRIKSLILVNAAAIITPSFHSNLRPYRSPTAYILRGETTIDCIGDLDCTAKMEMLSAILLVEDGIVLRDRGCFDALAKG